MKRALKLIVLASAVTVVFASCDLLSGIGIQSRIASFEDALNEEDRSDVYLNFSEAQTQNYNAIKDATYWDNSVTNFANAPYEITITDSSDTNNVIATFSHAENPDGWQATFVMVSDGIDWYIKQFWLEGVTEAIIRRP